MTLRVEGLDEAIRNLDKLSGGTWINAPLYEYGRAVQAKTAPYPPQRPTTYRRTGTLGRSWYTQLSQRKVTIANRAPYSGYVQQKETQAWMHRGHWATVEDRAEEQIDVFWRAVKRKVEAMFR